MIEQYLNPKSSSGDSSLLEKENYSIAEYKEYESQIKIENEFIS